MLCSFNCSIESHQGDPFVNLMKTVGNFLSLPGNSLDYFEKGEAMRASFEGIVNLALKSSSLSNVTLQPLQSTVRQHTELQRIAPSLSRQSCVSCCGVVPPA